MTYHVGDRVRVVPPHGDATRGSWPRFAGKVGTIVRVNRENTSRVHMEYGIVFGTVHRHSRTGNLHGGSEPTHWFLPEELQPVGQAPQAPQAARREVERGLSPDKREEARYRRQRRLHHALMERCWLELQTLPHDRSVSDELDALERLLENA